MCQLAALCQALQQTAGVYLLSVDTPAQQTLILTHMRYRRSNGSVFYRRAAKLETLQTADRLVCITPGSHSGVSEDSGFWRVVLAVSKALGSDETSVTTRPTIQNDIGQDSRSVGDI